MTPTQPVQASETRLTERTDNLDGTINGLFKGNETCKGVWPLDGDKLCLDYEGAAYDSCGALSRSANEIFILKNDGASEGRPATLEAGNAD